MNPGPLTSRADVRTEAPARYAKQLTAHLGRKLRVQPEEEGTRIIFPEGDCLMVVADGVLRLRAAATSTRALAHVEEVVGRHLERFGARAGLVVTWVR